MPTAERWRDWAVIGRFATLHLSVLSVFLVPFDWSLPAWLAGSYLLRMFGVTAGYHRYFSHRSYKLGRATQFAMALLAQSSAQKGVLWWAAHHRDHHRHSDRETDVHSPRQQGFWWAHLGWIMSSRFDAYEPRRIADFGRYPELRWLDRHHWVPTVAFGALVFAVGGLSAFVWGYLLSTVVLYHATFAINSVAHVWGTRRFATGDDSRNNWWLGIATLGEGWHNNHHHCMSSCRQGIRWWEFDATYVGLRVLEAVGIARELRPFVERAAGHTSPSGGRLRVASDSVISPRSALRPRLRASGATSRDAGPDIVEGHRVGQFPRWLA